MGRLDTEGFAPRVGVRRVPGRHRRRRGPLLAALLAIALLCCLFGSVAPASAAPPDSSPQVLWAMLAVQQAHLLAADGVAGDYFGHSVAISGDTALVGANAHTPAAEAAAGAAYVFVRSGTAWAKQKMLSAADAAGDDAFGTSVALSGETALVGAPNHDIGAKDSAGASYVFARSGTTWSQQAEPIATDNAAYDGFGASVALSGETALVGSQWDNTVAGTDAGSAYAFVLTP